MKLYLDLETRSATMNLPQVGVYRYINDCEITLCAWVLDDDASVGVMDWATDPEGYRQTLKHWIAKPDTQVIAHNAEFDFTVLGAHGVHVPVEQRYCTMAQARRHGLPGGLDALCDIFKIPQDQAKVKDGRRLVLLFCKPRPDGSWADASTHPADWRQYREYARMDVMAMRALHKVMPQWNDALERSIWELDLSINARGFAVDCQLARQTVEALKAFGEGADAGVEMLTDGAATRGTQRDRILKCLLEEFDVSLPDMTASTLERRLKDPALPDGVRELIALRMVSSKSSTAKYATLLRAVSRDGRLRGSLSYCGAGRTGRWAGQKFQPHNLPRPTLDYPEIEAGITELRAGVYGLV